MNTTLEHHGISGRALSKRYVAALAAAALATATLLMGAAWQGSTGSVPASTSLPAAKVSRALRPTQFFYIVGSEAEASAVLRAIDDDREGPRPAITMLIAGSPAAEEFLYAGVEALMQAGIDFKVIDQASLR